MIKLLTVIGARPQIIKAAAFSRAVAARKDEVCEKILHTGQHYDENMSGVFFGELGIPQPDYNLGVGSGSHGEQTAKMIEGIEKVLTERIRLESFEHSISKKRESIPCGMTCIFGICLRWYFFSASATYWVSTIFSGHLFNIALSSLV